MKQILLAAVMLLSIGFTANAQTNAVNTTGCNVEVTVYCYDKFCTLVSTTGPIPVANTGTPVPLPSCSPGDYTVYEVCWGFVPGCGFPTMCDFVDGTPGGPSPCGPGTFSAQIQSCDVCNNGGDGIGYIDYDQTTNELLITP